MKSSNRQLSFSLKILACFISVIYLSGCSTVIETKDQYIGPAKEMPEWKAKGEIHKELTSLPLPKGEILTSVYGFRDQTGQYKPSPSSTFSTAVSQGASSILVKALMDSGWFTPIEREGIQNLLTERKIIRATLNQTTSDIPPLLGANIMIEGGIIGYDTNIKTGGAGAKYFGIGVSEKYRVDQVTVSLRAVDIFSGKVIHMVSTTKSILSRQVDSGAFRFIKFKRLLEVEAGYTRNEPVQVALVDAIETSVMRLIVGGIDKNLWFLAEPMDIAHPTIRRYSNNPVEVDEPIVNIEHIVPKNNQKHPRRITKTTTVMPAEDKPALMPTASKNESTQASLKPKPVIKHKLILPTKPGEAPTLVLANSDTKPSSKQTVAGAEKAKTVTANAAFLKYNLKDQSIQSAINSQYRSTTEDTASNYYSIQLVSSPVSTEIHEFASQNALTNDDLTYINYSHNGIDRFALLVGKYDSKANAIKAIEALPQSLKVYEPWIRFVNRQQ